MAILFHDKDTRAFPYSEEQNKTRAALGAAIGKLIQAELNKQATLPPENVTGGIGAHLTEARDKGTDSQRKKWARQGRTMMCELAIPVPALTITIPGGGTLKTKSYNILFNAVLDTPQPAAEEKPTEENPTPVLRALTLQELLARQQASRTASKTVQ